MNILYIVPHDVGSCRFGSEQRTHLLYKSLLEIGDVYVAQVSDETVKVRDCHWKIAPCRPKGLKRLICSVWWRMAGLVCKRLVLIYSPVAYKLDIGHVYPNIRFDAVVVRYLYNVGLTHCWSLGDLYADIDDYPMQVFETTVAKDFGCVRRLFARLLQRMMVWLCIRKLTGAWIANPDQLPLISGVKKSGVLRNMPIVNLPQNRAAGNTAKRGNYLFTVGLMGYEPNYKGVDSFLRNVWPSVKAAFPHLEYWIAGKGAPEELSGVWSSMTGVKVLGYVEDLLQLYENCLASVVPVDSGGGTCIKTLESLAYGRICFSTRFGARGFCKSDVDKNKLGLFIYKTADDFRYYLKMIIADEILRMNFERQNALYFSSNYSFDSFVGSVRKVLCD